MQVNFSTWGFRAILFCAVAFGVMAEASAELSQDKLAVLKRAQQAQDYMPSQSTFAGERAENLRARTLVLLKADEKRAFGIDPSAYAFANFRDHERFYVAYIPGIKVDEHNVPTSSAGVVSEVHAMQEHWAAKTKPALAGVEAHTYLRFYFKQGFGVRLVFDQTSEKTVDASLAPISPVVLSIEAVRPKSQPNADFMPGALVYDFAIASLFYSQHDRDLWEKDDTGKVVDDWKLNLSRQQSRVTGVSSPADAILVRSVQESHNRGRSQTYNFVESNCTNHLFELLDNAVITSRGFDRHLLVDEIKVAVKQNVAQELMLLKEVAASKGRELPPSLLSELSRMTAEQITTRLVSAAETSDSPKEFATWLPPFVRPHLVARQLIAPSK